MSIVNREYKDRLFLFLFGREENRSWTLSLYNAVNGSDYSDPSMIQITTIEQVIYLGMHNDVSFIIGEEMSLYEQQSSYNPNMPLRQLQLAGNLYEKYLKDHKLNKYGSRLLQLPVPKLIVFYNGKEEKEEEITLHLSDSFPEGTDPDIEVKVRMININYGKNESLLQACTPLMEYSWLVAEIRKLRVQMELEDAVDHAISNMPKDFAIKPFLIIHRTEVKTMLLTEYDEEEVRNLIRKDALEEGREKGREEGVKKTLRDLVKDGLLSVEDAARKAGMTVSEFEAWTGIEI